jgi:hypothetical protein
MRNIEQKKVTGYAKRAAKGVADQRTYHPRGTKERATVSVQLSLIATFPVECEGPSGRFLRGEETFNRVQSFDAEYSIPGPMSDEQRPRDPFTSQFRSAKSRNVQQIDAHVQINL